MRVSLLFVAALAACSSDSVPVATAVDGDFPLPHFVSSRKSGVAPLAVHFDASELIAPGVNGVAKPFFDVVYRWDFGDPDSGHYKYGNQESKNVAFGAVAAHVFEPTDWKNEVEETREYEVTLWMRLPGDEGLEVEQTETITVHNPYWYYPGYRTVAISNTGDFSGADPGWLHVTANGPGDWAVVRQYLSTSTAAAPVRVLLQQGETWQVDRLHQFRSGSDCGTLGVFGIGRTAHLLRVPEPGDSYGKLWVAAVEDDGLDYDPSQWIELSPEAGR